MRKERKQIKKQKIKIYYDIFNGNDQTGDGTKENPFRTLFKAISSVSDRTDFEAQFIPLHND
jgi:hypothetical protein